jgi:hypothetical protein
LTWLRPLWWVARGWLALEVALWSMSALFGVGHYEDYWKVVPHARGWGWLLLLLAVGGSILVGLARVWPGGRASALPRTVLLVLNVVAICLVPVSLAMVRNQSEFSNSYADGYMDGQAQATRDTDGVEQRAGVYSGGRWVTNIYPYDASGKPLVGVQLFDQLGKPIDVVAAPECPDDSNGWSVADPADACTDPATGRGAQGRVPYPWTNGAAQLENVFPLPTRIQDDLRRTPTAFAEGQPPTIGRPPLASVPAVSLPGITPSVQAPRVEKR